MSLTIPTLQFRRDHETAVADEGGHGKGEIPCECPGLRLLNRVHTWTCVPFLLTGRVFRQLIVRLADWLGLC